ncbi:hypothetical protein [Paracoccus everestensis]|uniref:hypothetical protein n=1 Tax=Paracoccus everestensis TaxID=2903900 RepID=UPI001F2FF9D4|nr:hypothetical protein [Paracoccus everestensis]
MEAAAEAITDATPAELRAMRSGVVGQIEHILGNVRTVASDPNVDARQAMAAYKELSSPNAQRKMEALFGDDWPNIQKTLDQAGSASGLRASTAANSRTAGREAFRALPDDATAPSALARGEPIGTARSMWQRMTGASPENIHRVQAGVRDQLADVLTKGQASDLMEMIEKARRAAKSNPALPGRANRAAITALLAAAP